MYLLALDPGTRTGWAMFREGKETGRGVWSPSEVYQNLTALPGLEQLEIVAEDYVNDPGTPTGGRRNPASEILGAVDYIAWRFDLKVTRQRAADMHHAMKFVGYEEPKTKTGRKKHVPDEDSAYLHGVYYLVKRGIMKPLPLS